MSKAHNLHLDGNPIGASPCRRVTADQRHDLIACAAYYRAQRRDFAPGGELDDWLESEREIARHFSDDYYHEAPPT